MTASNSSLQRKERSEQLLKSLGVPVNPYLPTVESEAEAKFRDPKEVAKRAIALDVVISVAHGNDREIALSWLKDEGLWNRVSPKEKAFVESNDPPAQEIIASTWRVESLWVLLWALGEIQTLELPRELCDTDKVRDLMSRIHQHSWATFVNQAEIRSPLEILDASDLIYRIDWAVVDARLKSEEVPGGFDPGVVYERHYAINWLTCYSDEWDDVTTDT